MLQVRERWRARAKAAGVALAVCAAVTGAVGGTGWASTKAGGAAASAKAKITADWEAFFSGKTSANRKIQLVQDGSAFAAVIKAQSGSSMAQSVGVKVSSVTLNKAMTGAAVVYTITLGGAPALANQKGTAVLQDGIWKVGAQSFCALLALEGSAGKVSVCKTK